MPDKVGHFRIVRKIGEGGMGVVYEAWDERLQRPVALKTIHAAEESERARKQLWSEARSLARLSHPHICQLFDAVEQNGELFLVLELLEGAPLSGRLAGGPLAVPETVRIISQILEALDALHAMHLVHRDLKPSNVFLTPHGAKLLDFGLVRSSPETPLGEETLTAPGTLVGTPRYMAPEQAGGLPSGPAADIFATGCILYEMLAGRPAFDGASVVDVLYAVVHHNPPPLAGSRGIETLDQVVRRAMAKRPKDRYASARDMLHAVDAISVSGTAPALPHRTITRLIALPFRVFRKDEETDFLAYSLPDAISTSLSNADGFVVRSTLMAARFDNPPDPRRIAVEADVDAILAGTLMRAGDQLRLATQLIEAPSGSVIWSDNAIVSMADLFSLQDELSNRIVKSLRLPLTERDNRILARDRPASPRAYEFYLRANQVAAFRSLENMMLARDLYSQCLEEDPAYAPAWARLGRVCAWIEKFGGGTGIDLAQANEAFRKAFTLNPDLAIAHNLFTLVECDQGNAPSAMLRLLERARLRRNDADLFAGLVQACRYCDELEASCAAHERARHLDPNIVTSVTHTYFLLGDYRQTIEYYGTKSGFYLDCAARVMLGDRASALAQLRQRVQSGAATGAVRAIMLSLRAYLEGDQEGCLRAIEEDESLMQRSPESLFYAARHLAQLGRRDRALDILSSLVDKGFLCGSALSCDPWFDSLHSHPGFPRLLEAAAARQAKVHAAFLDAGGLEILNLSSACRRVPTLSQ
jgi:non-specific serine/threonine protein kinase